MPLRQIVIEGFRNLQPAEIEWDDYLNVITGANAAGKTSALEAIHYLARARSFAAVRADRLIQYDAGSFLIRGLIGDKDVEHRVAMHRLDGRTHVRLDGEVVRSLSEVARLLPIQVINTESQRLLTDGPAGRRAFLNWGLFHVEHQFRQQWRRYDRALRQRNVALRAHDRRLAEAWEGELAAMGEAIDAARHRYVTMLQPSWQKLIADWLPSVDLTAVYRRGWSVSTPLREALERSRAREIELGYTLPGPHRADLRLMVLGVEAAQALSRGQQKLAVIALRVVQTELSASAVATPVVLVDDLPAELDEANRRRVLAELDRLDAQLFVTAVERHALPLSDHNARLFHVEQGVFRQMVH